MRIENREPLLDGVVSASKSRAKPNGGAEVTRQSPVSSGQNPVDGNELLRTLAADLRNVPEVRSDRVEHAKQRLSNGDYSTVENSKKLADVLANEGLFS